VQIRCVSGACARPIDRGRPVDNSLDFLIVAKRASAGCLICAFLEMWYPNFGLKED
jgi:hypothetical protein